ncbi:hypothetical protein I2485_01135, partial [Nesterenkonia sp. E16_7]|nr:hypothetical protein [Nesterenkonia sp. E16_7]
MSANSDRNEAGRPADENEDFESGLDYGAFASEEPDFPDDNLSAERDQRPARTGQGQPDDQATQAIPATRAPQGTPGPQDQEQDAPTENIPRTPAQGAGAQNPNATRSLDDLRTSRDTHSMEDTTTFTGAAAAGAGGAGAAGAGTASSGTASSGTSSSAAAAEPGAAQGVPSPTPATPNQGADTHQPTENAAELSRREQRRRERAEAKSEDQDTAVVPATSGASGSTAGAAAGAGAGAA